MTFLAALRHDRIAAPCLFDGLINGASFLAWVDQFLLPALRAGDIVIMDNLGSPRGIAVRAALRTVGAKLFFLPPTAPISIPSNRSLPSSRPCCARPKPELSRPLQTASTSPSKPSRPSNAPLRYERKDSSTSPGTGHRPSGCSGRSCSRHARCTGRRTSCRTLRPCRNGRRGSPWRRRRTRPRSCGRRDRPGS